MSLVEVDDLRVQYGATCVVDGISFALEGGASLGIVGESGSGKSQTALAILALLPAAARVSGVVRFEGEDVQAMNAAQLRALRGLGAGIVFQDPMSSLNPHLAIGTQLCEGLRWHRGLDRRSARAEGLRLLEAVRLPDPARRLDQYPHQLSGGQRQRVMIAAALACSPRLLIADEPTTALDVTVQAGILDLLRSLRRDLGLTLLLISHDLGVVAELCDRAIVMRSGRVVEAGATAHLLSRPDHPYTRALLAARPRPGSPIA